MDRDVLSTIPGATLNAALLSLPDAASSDTEPGIPIEVLREDGDLRELLRTVRLLLEARGYRLNP
jgi:hypothetical protein